MEAEKPGGLNTSTPSSLQAVHDAKSEEIGPGIYRFKAEIGKMGAQLLVHIVA